jgi:hypothetical protein
LRGFTNNSVVSFLALFSARFSRIDFPAFLLLPLLGDFPDNGITPFYAVYLPDTIHTYIFYASFQRKDGKFVRCAADGVMAGPMGVSAAPRS